MGIYRAQGARGVRGYEVIDPLELREGAVIAVAVDLVRTDKEVSRAASEVRNFVIAAQELEHDVEVLVVLRSFDVDVLLTIIKPLDLRIFQPQTCDLVDDLRVKMGTGRT